MQLIHRILPYSILFIPLVLLIVFFSLLQMLFAQGNVLPVEEQNQEKIAQGLDTIKIIYQYEGEKSDLNLSRLSGKLVENVLTADIQEKTYPEVINQTMSNISIEGVKFPTLPVNQIRVSQDNSLEEIETYMNSVDELFQEYEVNLDLQASVEQALNGQTSLIENKRKKNQELYYELFALKVPSEVEDIHKMYLHVTQAQHHILTQIMYAKEDPLRLSIDTQLTHSILAQINQPLNRELNRLSRMYDIKFNK